LFAALRMGGREAGFQETMKSLLQQPVGRLLAFCLAIGLLCFAVWRFIEATAPPDHRAESLFRRVVFAGSGLFYLGLTALILNMTFRNTHFQSGSDEAAREWTGWLLELPGGGALAGATGSALVIGGMAILAGGCKRHFKSNVALHAEAPAFLTALGRYGLIARALVYAEIGGFLIYAAFSASSREAKGLAGAFRSIEQLNYGGVILSVIAVGFIAFGAYEFGAAIYRDLNPRRVKYDP